MHEDGDRKRPRAVRHAGIEQQRGFAATAIFDIHLEFGADAVREGDQCPEASVNQKDCFHRRESRGWPGWKVSQVPLAQKR